MPGSHWNPSFADLNRQRKYPLDPDTIGQDVTRTFQLPMDFLIGLKLPIPAFGEFQPTQFFISQLSLDASGVVLIISHHGDSVQQIASVFIPLTTSSSQQTYNLTGLPPYQFLSGFVTVGQTDSLKQQPPGLWLFELADTRLDVDVIQPALDGLTGIYVRNGESVSPILRGNLEFISGNNFRLAVTPTETGARITFNAIAGEGLIDDCECAGETSRNPIRSVNGLTGDIELIGTDCMVVKTSGNTITLADSCAKPCCGCEEMEAVTAELVKYAESHKSFSQSVETQQAALSAFRDQVLITRVQLPDCYPEWVEAPE